MCLASIVMTQSPVLAAAPAIVDFSASTPEITTSTPPADRLLAGTPQQIARNYFSDTTGKFFAGIWESTPGKWRIRYTENEFCHLIQGRVRISDGNGRSRIFETGDTFVIPSGFAGEWEVLESARKLYVVYEP